MNSVTTFILSVIVAFIAYQCYQNAVVMRHWVVLVTFGQYVPGFKTYGSSCDNTPIQDPKASTRIGKWAHCFTDGKIREVNSHHDTNNTKEELLSAINAGCPVLIHEPFPDDKCYDRVLKAAEEDKNFSVRVKENIPMLMNNNSVFPTPEFDNFGGARKAYHYSLSKLLSEFAEGPSIKYSSFDNTLGGDEFTKIWGMDLDFLKGKAGSTFLSNYDKTITTAPMHSALWYSFGYQCAGNKDWKFMTPEDALPTVRFHTIFTSMKNCDNRPDIAANLFDVHTGPDTLLFFPPFWAHSVQTQPGISALFNYRALYLPKMFKNNFFTAFLTLTGLIYYGTFYSSWDPEEVGYYYFTGETPNLGGQNSRLKDFGGRAKAAKTKSFLDKFD